VKDVLMLPLQVRLKDFQHAAKAQRASVTPAEILRYEEYNERHGAKYVLQQQEGQEDAESEGDDVLVIPCMAYARAGSWCLLEREFQCIKGNHLLAPECIFQSSCCVIVKVWAV